MSDLDTNTQEGNECPTCGKVLPTEVGLKQHHTKVHGESLVHTQECVVCGDEFQVRPSGEGKRYTCSYECKGKRRSENGLPAKKRRVTKECANCGEVMSVRRSKADTKRYCSNECYYDDSDGEVLECEWCGEEFYAYDSYADKARFCSQECYGKSMEIHGNAPERPPYGRGWNEDKREAVRERDGRTCVDCGLPEEWHKRMYGVKLHVHHKISPWDSDDPDVHNAMENLVTLCAICHRKCERDTGE